VRVVVESHWRDERWEGEIPETPASLRPLDHVWRFFQRVDDADAARLDALGYRLPSLSVGDVVELDGLRWRAASLGWEPDDEPSSDPLVQLRDALVQRAREQQD
jgi:hypothetical protein